MQVSKALRHPLCRAFVPVLGTYVVAVAGIMWGPVVPIQRRPMSPLAGGLIVLLFTLSHAVGPVFFYRIFMERPTADKGARPPGCVGVFIYFHMGTWFGIPIIGLAALTNWLSLAWAVAHVSLAPRGTRTWTFLENGSTSLALVMFLVTFSPEAMFPWGAIVIVCQSAFLTVLEYKARPLWVAQVPVASSQPKGDSDDKPILDDRFDDRVAARGG